MCVYEGSTPTLVEHFASFMAAAAALRCIHLIMSSCLLLHHHHHLLSLSLSLPVIIFSSYTLSTWALSLSLSYSVTCSQSATGCTLHAVCHWCHFACFSATMCTFKACQATAAALQIGHHIASSCSICFCTNKAPRVVLCVSPVARLATHTHTHTHV